MQNKMRAGGCTFQQALTHEASAIVKQAVTLARRRGHAQVTPLHVAQAMLSASSSLLRAACLQSHSHPFQCRALELCFNVALNRLPTSTSTSILGFHSYQPTISNALIAAFKRAQAQQRRGTIENQQQPVLVVKIELEQLIISILDDPSISRVMREAGLSSTIVKGKVEQALSMELSSLAQSPSSIKSKDLTSAMGVVKGIRLPNMPHQAKDEDITILMESLANSRRRRGIVIVGECTSTLEGVVREMMDKVEKGEVHQDFKESKFLQLPLRSFGHLKREEVDQRLWEIKYSVKRFVDSNKGVILYLGDLKWAIEFKASIGVLHHQQVRNCYCPVDHMVFELGRLLSSYSEKERVWLIGISTFQTYNRCRTNHLNSLETIWGLNAITFPVGGLCLSLVSDSDAEGSFMKSEKGAGIYGPTWLSLEGNREQRRDDPSAMLDKEARFQRISTNTNVDSKASSNNLPSWLQEYKDELRRSLGNKADQDTARVHDLWNSMGHSVCDIQPADQSLDRTIGFSSSASNGKYMDTREMMESGFSACIEQQNDVDQRHEALSFLSSTPNTTPNSTSSSEIMEIESVGRLTVYNNENLKLMCRALEKVAPLLKETILEIASTVLSCRSGMGRRKGGEEGRHDTWLLFHGLNTNVNEKKISKELARLAFGSERKYTLISPSNISSSSTGANSSADSRKKRMRDDGEGWTYVERFAEEISKDPHRVFFLEEFDQVEHSCQMSIMKALERGKMSGSECDEEGIISFSDAVVILSCESGCSRSRSCSPSSKKKWIVMEEDTNSCSPCVSLDLNKGIDDGSDDEDNDEGDQFVDEIGLVGYVDRCVSFNV